MEEPDKEEFDAYLLMFQRRVWRKAVADQRLVRLLSDFFTSNDFWGVNNPLIASKSVLNNIGFYYENLKPLSKLDFALCFPYVKFQQYPIFHHTLHAVAEAIFKNPDATTNAVVNDYQTILRSSTEAEKHVKAKFMHLDTILSTPKLVGHTSEAYTRAIKSLQSGLQNMIREIQYEKEEDLAVSGILSGNFDDELFGPDGYEESHVEMFEDGFDMPQLEISSPPHDNVASNSKEIEEANRKADTYQLTDSMRKLAHTKIKKQKAQQLQETQNKTKEAKEMAKIHEIIQREAENYKKALEAKLSYPNLDEADLNGKSFELLEERHNPNHAKEKQRNLAQTMRAASTAAKKRAARLAESPPLQCNQKPSITEPTTVRLRGQIVMQSNPMVKRAIKSQEQDPSAKITHHIMRNSATSQPYVKTYVATGTGRAAKIVEKITPVNQLEKTKFVIQRPTVGSNYCLLPKTLTRVPSLSEREDERTDMQKYSKTGQLGKLIVVKKVSQVPYPYFNYRPLRENRDNRENKNYSKSVLSFKKQTVPAKGHGGKTLLCRPYKNEFGQTVLRLFGKPQTARTTNAKIVRKPNPQNIRAQKVQLEDAIPINRYRAKTMYVPKREQQVRVQEQQEKYQINDELLSNELHQNNPIVQVAHEEVVGDGANDYIQHKCLHHQDHQNPMGEMEETVVSYEEIQDNGEIEFQPPRDDDWLFDAEEIDQHLMENKLHKDENVLFQNEHFTVVRNPYNITENEYAEVQESYPDLFGPTAQIEDDLKFMIAAFMFGRLENPRPKEGTAFNFKVSEITKPITIDNFETKQVIENFFEMSYDTMLWTRIRRTKVYRQDAVYTTVESLDLVRTSEENSVYLTEY